MIHALNTCVVHWICCSKCVMHWVCCSKCVRHCIGCSQRCVILWIERFEKSIHINIHVDMYMRKCTTHRHTDVCEPAFAVSRTGLRIYVYAYVYTCVFVRVMVCRYAGVIIWASSRGIIRSTGSAYIYVPHTYMFLCRALETYIYIDLHVSRLISGFGHICNNRCIHKVGLWIHIHPSTLHLTCEVCRYGVATISRLLKIIGLFYKRAL